MKPKLIILKSTKLKNIYLEITSIKLFLGNKSYQVLNDLIFLKELLKLKHNYHNNLSINII